MAQLKVLGFFSGTGSRLAKPRTGTLASSSPPYETNPYDGRADDNSFNGQNMGSLQPFVWDYQALPTNIKLTYSHGGDLSLKCLVTPLHGSKNPNSLESQSEQETETGISAVQKFAQNYKERIDNDELEIHKRGLKISELESEYRRVLQQRNNEWSEVQNRDEKIISLEKTIADLTHQMNKDKTALFQVRSELKDLKANRRRQRDIDKAENEVRLVRMRQDHERLSGGLHRQINSLNADRAHERQSLQDEHRRLVQRLENEHKEAVKALHDSRILELTDLNRQHSEVVTRLQNEISAMGVIHSEEVSDLTNKAAEFRDRLQGDYKKLKEQHEREKDRLRNNHLIEREKMETKHQAQMVSLSSDIEAISTVLLQRDKFEELALADNIIRTRYDSIVAAVDDLATAVRNRWLETGQSWIDDILKNVPTAAQRLAKQKMVKDIIWDLLYRHIFYSPFRILGLEGRKLEMKWSTECGKGERPMSTQNVK